MSDISIQSGDGRDGAFNPATMLIITAIGALAFIAMLVLGAYAPDLRSGHNGGSHALSNAATGFSGLVHLAEETGRKSVIVRAESDFGNENLAVITPDHGSANLGKILEARGARATLIVLPKWLTMADPVHGGWVRVLALLPPDDPERTLYPANPLTIIRMRSKGEALVNAQAGAPTDMHFLAPAIVQTMRGEGLEPLITTKNGGIVLAKLARGSLYVLSEPDLINNHGLGDERQAKSALALLDYLNSTGNDGVLFDVTANGLGHSKSPLKLAFSAPFLAVTLTIFAAMLLAAWQALVRFGPIQKRARAIAFGKKALVDNSAALIRKAGREAHLGGRYVELVRERAIGLFSLPATLDPSSLDARLEGLNVNRSFASAAEAACNARSRDDLLGAARSLNQWLEEIQQ